MRPPEPRPLRLGLGLGQLHQRLGGLRLIIFGCAHRMFLSIRRRACLCGGARAFTTMVVLSRGAEVRDRKSVVWGTSVSVRIALDGRRILKKKNKTTQYYRIL